MSGHKRATVTIDQDEYRRLQAVDNQIRKIQTAHIDEQTLAHYQNAIQHEYDLLFSRQEQYQEWLASVNNQMQTIEGRVSDRFTQQQEDFYQQINEVSENLWCEVDHVLQEQQQLFQSQIDTLYYQQEDQLKKLDRAVRSINADRIRKENLAQKWIEVIETIARFIEEHYDFDKFAPGKLQEIVEELQTAKDDLIEGLPEAALATAQQSYRKCSRLRLELEHLENQWQIEYIATCESIDHIYGIISKNWRIRAVDLNGNEIDQVVEVDYWSGGRLSQAITQIDHLRNHLISDSHNISTDELNHIRTINIRQIEEIIHECRFQARLEALSSQIRINIADLAICALEQQGFMVEKSGYDRHDQRYSYTATTRSIDGGEVILKVIPSTNEVGKNDLHVHSLDSEIKTQHELRLRAETIRRALANYGLDIGPMEIKRGITYPTGTAHTISKKISDSDRKTLIQ